ncbi:MAG TPA: PAS domain-containing protein [Bacteriovoracaceae bacterium]|nr:PAS domain-containing protein [Bacteriovoracaceae bacterium]
MKKSPTPFDEQERLAELIRYSILDTPSEEAFDEITKLAAELCGCKRALISLVGPSRVWFKSKVGVDATEWARDISYCGHAIMSDDIFVIEDSGLDERFSDNPMFHGQPNIRFYAGAPLVMPSRKCLGTLCIIDSEKKVLSDSQKKILKSLAKHVVDILELRYKNIELSKIEYSQKLKLETAINDLVESKKNLLMANQYLDLALEGTNLGVWDWHLTTNQVVFDKRWASMLGLKVEDLTHEIKTWETLVHPEDLAKCYEDVKAYLDGKTASYENVHRLKHTDGHWVYVLDRGKFSAWDNEGKPIRFTGTHFDLTMQKTLEQELLEAQSIAKTGSWHFNLATQEQTWSKEHYKIFEIEESQPKAKLFQLYKDRIHPDDLPGIEINFKKTLKDGENFIFNHRLVFDNGARIKHVQDIGKLNRDSGGLPVSLSGTCRDRTLEVVNEQKLQEERTKALHNAKLSSIGQLAAGVGHEINNPLAIISGQIFMAEKLLSNNAFHDPQIVEYFKDATLAISRIANIVKGLRTFARSDDNQISEFDPFDVVEETIGMLKEIYKREEVALTCNIRKTPIFIKGNRGRIQQVLINLINNAKDASVGVLDRKINVNLFYEKGFLKFMVSDNGRGISEEIRGKIFEPFFTTKGVNEGTGIGLSLVNTIVKEHEGKIEVETEVDKGSCFTVYLPVNSIASVAPSMEWNMPVSNPDQVKDSIKGEFNILVVDDEEMLRKILKSILSMKGYNVTVAEDAHEALRILNEKTFDLVISDIKMPAMDGFQFLNALRSKKLFVQPRFLFISGGVEMSPAQEEIIEQETDGFLNKPFDFDMIDKRLAEIFSVKIVKSSC